MKQEDQMQGAVKISRARMGMLIITNEVGAGELLDFDSKLG